MNRHPWRTRAGLLALVNALAGVGIALGLTSSEVVDPFTAIAVAVAALLADLGILRDGESETTPVDDPLDRAGNPLVPYTTAAVQPATGPSDAQIAALYDQPDHTD